MKQMEDFRVALVGCGPSNSDHQDYNVGDSNLNLHLPRFKHPGGPH